MALFNQSYINIASQFGMPLFGVAGTPPFTGNYFWVDPNQGSDGNTGGPQDPFKTLTQAHSACLSGNNDVVFLTGSTGAGVSAYATATVNWTKNCTHLIGLCPPLKRGKQARLAISGTTAFSPLLNVTASDCIFSNFQLFSGFATDALTTSYALADSGGRNCYDNVEILGFGAAGTAGNTGARAAYISGTTGENTFRNCIFGVDTITRGVANYTVELAGGLPRCHFIGCEFEMDASAATPAHLYTAAASALDRYTYMENCTFMNSIGSGATTINQVASLAASAGGFIVMTNCRWVGATHLETTASNQIWIDMPAPSNSAGGKTINNTTD